jgi:hypothetical protein
VWLRRGVAGQIVSALTIEKLARNLPEQLRFAAPRNQAIQQLLGLGLLHRFVRVKGVNENIRVNGVHGARPE